MSEVPVFVAGEYYSGTCDEVRVVERGGSKFMEYGFAIGDFRQYTSVFLGSDPGKFGKSNDDQAKEDLVAFGAEEDKLSTGNIMAYIRGLMIGKTIEFMAKDYKGEIQFNGCRPPGKRRGPNVVITENPFGMASAPAKSSGGVF